MAAAGLCLAATACSGASSTPASSPESDCPAGPQLSGVAEIGAGSEGFITDIDGLTISMGGRTGGGSCVGFGSGSR